MDVVTGKFYYRPYVKGKRTWRILYSRTLAEAKAEYRQLEELKKSQRIRERLLGVINEPTADLTNLPSCLYKYAHMVKVYYPPRPERGLYFLMDGRECVYVGQSDKSVLVRVAQHGLDKNFDKVFYVPFQGELDTPERHFIALLKPKYNSKNIDGFVEEPFETPTQRKYRQNKAREKIIKACIKCGDSVEEAKKKAKFLLSGKNFSADFISDDLPVIEPMRGKPANDKSGAKNGSYEQAS